MPILTGAWAWPPTRIEGGMPSLPLNLELNRVEAIQGTSPVCDWRVNRRAHDP